MMLFDCWTGNNST